MRIRQYLVKKIFVPIGYSYKINIYKKKRHGFHSHFYKKRFRRIRNQFPKIENLDKELDQIQKTINENENNNNKTEENKENQNQMKVDENA